ncbi:Sister chromatid cohesion protein 2, partial [Linderina pennispora]
MKTLQELWFSYNDAGAITDDQASLGSSANIFNSLAPEVQRQMMKRVRVMTGVMEATRTRELSELMGTLFEHVTKDVSKTEADAAMFVARCVIDALFEQLLRSEETESASVFSTSACLRFLSALSGIAPEAVGARAEMLSAYLKMTSPSEEEMLSNALHIFQNSVLTIPHPSPQFLSTLERDLIALLSSSPQSILVEAVPCLCMIVEKLTRDYSRIIKLFRSCVLQLYRERRLIESGAAAMQSPKNAMRFMILAGLLCRHFDFDKHRTELETQFKELALLARGMMIPEFMSSLLLFFAAPRLPATVQLAAIQMLGQLYIKRPQLALSAAGRDVVDRVFAGSNVNHKLQVMRNFLEFLRDDAQRYVQKAKEGKGKGKKKKKVDARALVGNTDDMGEAGVGASLMQTYLERIIDATFVANAPLLRAAGFEVISLVLEQGLAHPLMCVPALIALSTDTDAHIRNKSLKLHQDLAGKHASFIHSRDLEGVRKAFEYQSQVRNGPQYVSGYNDAVEPMESVQRPVAYLQPLYTMLRSKRTRRNDFLTMLVNIGDVDGSADDAVAGSSVPNQHLVRFVAENISALDFKYLDEVLLVAYQISSVIAGTGLTVFQLFETEGSEGVNSDSTQWRAATETSVSITILFMLREFLKAHYGVTEARCSGFNPNDTSSSMRDKSVAWHAPTSSQQSSAGCGRIDWSA